MRSCRSNKRVGEALCTLKIVLCLAVFFLHHHQRQQAEAFTGCLPSSFNKLPKCTSKTPSSLSSRVVEGGFAAVSFSPLASANTKTSSLYASSYTLDPTASSPFESYPDGDESWRKPSNPNHNKARSEIDDKEEPSSPSSSTNVKFDRLAREGVAAAVTSPSISLTDEEGKNSGGRTMSRVVERIRALAGIQGGAIEGGGGNIGNNGGSSSTTPNAVQLLVGMTTSEEFKKLLVWLSFFGLAWKLRSFYGIMLGTFVLSWIGSSTVRWSERKGNNLLQKLKLPRLPRRFWAFTYISVVLSSIMTLTVLTVPRVVGETNYLNLLIESENPYVFVADGIRKVLGPEVTSKCETFLLTVTGEEGRSFASGILAAQGTSGQGAAAKKALDAIGEAGGLWDSARSSRFAKLLEFSLKGYIKQGYYVLRTLLTSSTSLIYKGILSLLFSFMIVWDFPRLTAGSKKLAQSRLSFAYKVLSPQISAFAKLVGQSFEVQSMIALVNTILTTLGLVLLKIPGYGFMSLMVLITSFIPVFGVFLSTAPMALIALSEYGVRRMIDVILMVIGIHVVEAYCLSPLIYSATVKLHPVLILTALYMTEHLAGLQGVFLAVPITMFVIKQLIFNEGPPTRRPSSPSPSGNAYQLSYAEADEQARLAE